MTIEKMFEIRTMRQVYKMAAIITVFAVMIPVLTFAIPFTFLGLRYFGFFAVAFFPAALIPLLITPPIAIVVLNLFRVQTLTIDKVDHYVRYDTLTGVLTRAYLLGKTQDALDRGGAFLMVDADHFKAINDTHGHDVGDEALKKIAEVLRKALSTDALIGRLGGEEFGVFLPGATDAEAVSAANNLCDLMRREAKVIACKQLDVTVSIGCAVHRADQSLEQTIKLADSALYHAKHSGRDRYFLAESTQTMPALILKDRMAR
ncbi:GGDEF domain-containing protein [Hoeflea sp. AS60]|uniref:GGDEF domain-containing protein n=1 Tax=Hoeflea sp. AS60 TaxID=3135780 RepID=UPI00316E5167